MRKPRLLCYDLSPKVVAFSTTRHGGYSIGDYGEFNINLYCGDKADAIKQNRSALCAVLGIADDNLVFPHQTHGVRGVVVDSGFLCQSSEQRKALADGCDYIYTQEKGVCIGVSTADCVPVLLYNEKDNVAIAVHAGWRGTLQRISFVAMREVSERLGCEPKDFRAVIGPSISQEAFEVGDEVYEAFRAADFDMQEIAARIRGKWHIDLWKANAMQLSAAGVCAENIKVSGVCTYNNHADFFSARRLGINSGRIFSGICIKQNP